MLVDINVPGHVLLLDANEVTSECCLSDRIFYLFFVYFRDAPGADDVSGLIWLRGRQGKAPS